MKRVLLVQHEPFEGPGTLRDALSPEVTEPLLEAIDRLLKAIARREAARE